VQNDLEPSDAGVLYGCFRHLAARTDPELRRACAAQLPALMKHPVPGTSATYLHDTWVDLSADHDEQVQRDRLIDTKGSRGLYSKANPWMHMCIKCQVVHFGQRMLFGASVHSKDCMGLVFGESVLL
jgi:hypothetical protein